MGEVTKLAERPGLITYSSPRVDAIAARLAALGTKAGDEAIEIIRLLRAEQDRLRGENLTHGGRILELEEGLRQIRDGLDSSITRNDQPHEVLWGDVRITGPAADMVIELADALIAAVDSLLSKRGM